MKKFPMLVVLLLCIFFFGCNDKDEEKGKESVAKVSDSICVEEGGRMETVTEGGEDFSLCMFDDGSFCFIEDLEKSVCKKGDIQYYDAEKSEIDIETGVVAEDEKIDCSSLPVSIVCGKDGNTYDNNCYLNEAGVEEESELAEVIDGECVFG